MSAYSLPDLAALELLPDAVVVVRRDAVVHACTQLAARLLEGSADEVVGRPAPEVVRLADEAGSDWWACVKPLEGPPRPVARLPLRDLQLTTLRGRVRPVSLTASRLGERDVQYLVLVLRRAEMRQRLDAARSDLVSTVSHEIRSPLTSVKGFTKTLLAKWDRFTDEQRRQMLATVNEDADRVTRLLSELLDVSRIDAGRLQLRRQMVDVGTIAERVVERLSAVRDDTQLRLDLPEDLPKLYADPDKVEQVFVNLLENALKYGAGVIRVAGSVGETTCEFVVSDEGPGVPQEHLSAVFTKFFRRSGERRTGTGLGLYITKGIVEAHGGRIWASTGPDGGASFHFVLPRGGLELAGIEIATRR